MRGYRRAGGRAHPARGARGAARLEQTTLAYAEKLAAKPPIAVQMCKKCINIATDAGTSVGLLAEEIQGIYTVSTKDKAEAAAAMLEKRSGRYTCE